MYKTVRQGENSLQYTILPQNEEALCHGGVTGRGRDVGAINPPAPEYEATKTNSTVVCFSIFVVGTIITSAVLIPFLVSSDVVPLPGWFSQRGLTKHDFLVAQKRLKFANTKDISAVTSERNHFKLLPTTSVVTSTEGSTPRFTQARAPDTITTVARGENITEVTVTDSENNVTTPADVRTQTPETTTTEAPADTTTEVSLLINLIRSTVMSTAGPTDSDEFNNSTEQFSKPRASNNDLMLNRRKSLSSQPSDNPPPTIISSTKILVKDPGNLNQSMILIPKLPSTKEVTATKTTRIITVAKVDWKNELKPLRTEYEMNSDILQSSDDVKITSSKSWLHTKWPFVDPSTYFQWAGYDSQDSLLLPIILGGALIAALLVLGVCLSARRRKRKAQRRETIGQITSDLRSGDKTNLLTENPSEED